MVQGRFVDSRTHHVDSYNEQTFYKTLQTALLLMIALRSTTIAQQESTNHVAGPFSG